MTTPKTKSNKGQSKPVCKKLKDQVFRQSLFWGSPEGKLLHAELCIAEEHALRDAPVKYY